jgi:hypothetical protein
LNISKIKTQKIYKSYREKQFIIWLFRNAYDKLKKLISFKETDRTKKESGKTKIRYNALPSQRHKQSTALLSFRNRPKPVDDTFTLNFAEWLRKRSLDVGTSGITSKTMNYTPRLESFHLQGQYYLLIKTKN